MYVVSFYLKINYFLDKIIAIKVAKAIIKYKASNTVMLSPP